MEQEQDELTDLQNQSTALSGLDSDFSALQTAFQSLQSALGTGSYGATSSDPTSVGVSASTGALDSVYSIAVSSVGSYSTSVSDASLPAVSDPSSTSISTSTDYTLTVDGNTFDIKPADGSLTSLAEAINDSSAGVQASLVNTGSSDSPQYRLILTSTSLGPDSIQLNDGSAGSSRHAEHGNAGQLHGERFRHGHTKHFPNRDVSARGDHPAPGIHAQRTARYSYGSPGYEFRQQCNF